jgi:hypothetical protein
MADRNSLDVVGPREVLLIRRPAHEAALRQQQRSRTQFGPRFPWDVAAKANYVNGVPLHADVLPSLALGPPLLGPALPRRIRAA